MTTLRDTKAAGPALHALVIGVGDYPHLPGGSGTLTSADLQLGQASMPVPSALAITEWLLTEYHNERVALGSIEVLISPTQEFPLDSTIHTIETATKDHVSTAVQAWLTRANSDPGNVSVFYFCGHGVEKDTQYLLLEDYGANPFQPTEASIALGKFHTGMLSCAAGTQLFIADACRQVPWDLLKEIDPQGQAFVTGSYAGNTSRDAPIMYATGFGDESHGQPNEVTRFTQALIAALRGAAADSESIEPPWEIRWLRLAECIQTLLAESSTGTTQRMTTGGQARNALIAELAEPPIVPLTIRCNPDDASAHNALQLSLTTDPSVIVFSRAPAAGTWSVHPHAADYNLTATLATGTISGQLVIPVRPPKRTVTLQVKP
jgi:hypothetical protein